MRALACETSGTAAAKPSCDRAGAKLAAARSKTRGTIVNRGGTKQNMGVFLPRNRELCAPAAEASLTVMASGASPSDLGSPGQIVTFRGLRAYGGSMGCGYACPCPNRVALEFEAG